MTKSIVAGPADLAAHGPLATPRMTARSIATPRRGDGQIRRATLSTLRAVHFPSRGVIIPRAFNAPAMPFADVMPSALTASIIAARPSARCCACALSAETAAAFPSLRR